MENKNSKTMKNQGIMELLIGISGITILLLFQNEWSYIALILYGILSVAMIRKTTKEFTNDEKKCMKKRNILSIVLLPFFAIVCYFSANELIRDDLLWILLAAYLFITAHGILFIAPINNFGNEKR